MSGILIFLCGFLCGSLVGTVAMLFMQMARSFGRQEIEGALLAALRDMDRCFGKLHREEYLNDAGHAEAVRVTERARLVIALATAESQS
jgi:hypothetical protein